MAYIYRLHDKDGTVCYVGQTTQEVEDRLKTYLGGRVYDWFKNVKFVSFVEVEDNKVSMYEIYYIRFYYQNNYKVYNKRSCIDKKMELPDGWEELEFSKLYKINQIIYDATDYRNGRETYEDNDIEY